MPGAANRETFGKLSEGSDIQNDVTDKPDTVESELQPTPTNKPIEHRRIDKEIRHLPFRTYENLFIV